MRWIVVLVAVAAAGCGKEPAPRDVVVGGRTFHLPCNARMRLSAERSTAEVVESTGCSASMESRLRLIDSKPKEGADPAKEVLFKFTNLGTGAVAPCGEGWVSSFDVACSGESWGKDYP